MKEEPPQPNLERVGLFPLPDISLLPHQLLPLHVFEPRYQQLVADAKAREGLIAIPRLKPGYELHYHGNPDLYDVCGLGRIVQLDPLSDGKSNILVRGLKRVRLVEELRGTPYRLARVEELADEEPSAPLAHPGLLASLQRLTEQLRPELSEAELTLLRAAELAAQAQSAPLDYLNGALVLDPEIRQLQLEEIDPSQRLSRWVAALRERLGSTSSAPGSSSWN